MVLLATNVIGDSLTLGRQVFSRLMTEWLERTVQFFAARPDVQLVVRIHPGELVTKGPSMADVVRQVLPSLPEHIHLIAADATVNTYDLVEIADLGLVYTTTVGMEMAMSGVPVIAVGNTHYRGKGFTLDPATWEAYFEILDQALKNPAAYRLSQAQVELAWNYAYRFFFDYPHPFPWHLLHIWEDLEEWPLSRVLSAEGQEQFGSTFRYLAGEPIALWISPKNTKQQVRQFYDQVGWQQVAEGTYQNAALRRPAPGGAPITSTTATCACCATSSRRAAYCWMPAPGRSSTRNTWNIRAATSCRVCADISIVALKEARSASAMPRGRARAVSWWRISPTCPSSRDAFDGVVSLHTIHHLPRTSTCAPTTSCTACWLRHRARWWSMAGTRRCSAGSACKPVRWSKAAGNGCRGRQSKNRSASPEQQSQPPPAPTCASTTPPGWKRDRRAHAGADLRLAQRQGALAARPDPPTPGRALWLRLLYRLEERCPHYFGENGQYPLIVIRRT